MKLMSMIGIVLIALGLIGLIYGGITYTSSRNTVSMGDMHVQVDETRQLPLSPIAGGVAVLVGILLIVFDRRGQARGKR